ncbi:MAG: fimbrillin family protein, partial [Prevotella sp.]|nr:fimbrillin family protein [Prevotella sp.]
MIHHKFRMAAPVLALAGLALLGSCTRDEEAPQAVSSIRGIDFDAGEDAPGSLKASPATGSQLTNFIVSAFWSDGDWDTGTRRLFDAQNVYKTEGGDWDYRPKKIWPSSGSVAFYAYAPAGSPNTDGLSGKGSS